MKNNRLYVLLKSPHINPVQGNGLNKNAFSNSFQLFFSNSHRAVRFLPKTGCGELINSNALIKKSIEKAYKLFPKNRYFISFNVHADSIKSFIEVRKYLHRRKFSYTWAPYMNDADLILAIGQRTQYKSY